MKNSVFFKRVFFVFIFAFFPLVICSAFNYWYLDVIVETYTEYFAKKNNPQRVYFFKDMESFEEATGFPIGSGGTGMEKVKTSWNWIRSSTMSPYPYHKTIYNQMRREGFVVAFVLNSIGSSFSTGEQFWIYNVFLIWNGIEYFDSVTRYGRPVMF